jgi:hypothetical protein
MDLVESLTAAVQDYRRQAVAAAEAEAAHKAARAKRCLEARHSGEAKTATEAEWIGEADERVGDLYSKRLITAALADATKQRILSIREAVGMRRSEMADARFQDDLHSRTAT